MMRVGSGAHLPEAVAKPADHRVGLLRVGNANRVLDRRRDLLWLLKVLGVSRQRLHGVM